MRVHILHPPTPESLTVLQENLDPGIELTFGEHIPDPADYQILVGGRPPREFMAASANLQALVIPWAGLPVSTRALMLEFPQITVHNLHHNAAPTAETALALLFAAAKLILPHDKALRAHDWRPR